MQYLDCVLVKPVNGQRVLDPLTMKPIAQEGEKLEYTPYWKRRELEGSVTISPVSPVNSAKSANSIKMDKETKKEVSK